MAFKITCPNGHPIMIRDEHVGRRLKCPACGAGLLAAAPIPPSVPSAWPQVPSSPPPATPVVASPPAKEEIVDYVPEADPEGEVPKHVKKGKHRDKSRRGRGRSGLPRLWIILGGAVLGLLIVMGVLWFLVLRPLVERFSFPMGLPEPLVQGFDLPQDRFHAHLKAMNQRHGERQVLVVCIKGLPFGKSGLALEKFMSLGFKSENMPIAIQTGPQYEFTWLIVGPVPDANALAKRIDFGRVVSVSSSRMNIVADVSKFDELLPESEKADPVTKAMQDATDKSLPPGIRADGIRKLRELPPDHRRVEVAKQLEDLLAENTPQVSSEAAKALGVWGGKDNVPALIKALEVKNYFIPGSALESLARIKDERAIEPIAKLLPDRAAALILMRWGPEVESAVVPYMNDPNIHVRWYACDILKEVATQKSVPALEARAADPSDGIAAGKAKEALDAIAKRARGTTR